MTLAEPGTIAAPPRPPRRRRWRLWVLLATGLACTVLAILAALASRYQPVSVSSEDQLAEAFAGLPSAAGVRYVNTFGAIHEDIYVPPQRGVFALAGVIVNNGTHPVTIVSAFLDNGPFAPAGPVRYSVPGMGGSNVMPPPTFRVLHDATLAPHQEMFLGFPVKMAWPCAANYSGNLWSIPSFNVTVRYLFFTHAVAVPWGMHGDSLIVRWPEGGKPGQKGIICAPGTTPANLPHS